MDFLKTMTGKVITGVVGLIVVTAAISWWQLDDKVKENIWSGIGHFIAFFGVVLLVPWVTFFIITWVHKFNNNLAGGTLVLVYSALETWLLQLLFPWKDLGTTGKTFFVVGTLLAVVYNLLICDWIAEKME